MRLGKASAYGVFATLDVAEHARPHMPIHGRDIARAYRIPAEYLLKILQRLTRSRVLASERGRNAGFVLHKAPEIVEAIDGPINGDLTARREIRGADQAKDAVQQICDHVAEHTRGLLARTTVRTLMNGNGAIMTPDPEREEGPAQ